MSFDLLTVCIWDFELFNVNWLRRFEHNFVHEGVSSAKVKFVLADCLMVLQNHLQILFFELFGHIKMNVLLDELSFCSWHHFA